MKLRGGCIFQPRYKRKGETRISQTYMIQYRVNGRLIRESAKTTDKKKANHLLVQRMAEAQKGKHTFPNRETLAAFLGAYLDDQRQTVDEGTWTRYEFCKKNLLKKNLLGDDSPLADIKLPTVTVGLLSEYLTYR